MLHKNIPTGERHGIVSLVYEDETARLGASLSAQDQFKVAFQSSDNSAWLLVSTSPITWVSLTGGEDAPTAPRVLVGTDFVLAGTDNVLVGV